MKRASTTSCAIANGGSDPVGARRISGGISAMAQRAQEGRYQLRLDEARQLLALACTHCVSSTAADFRRVCALHQAAHGPAAVRKACAPSDAAQ